MIYKFLQVNLNRSWQAFDLLNQRSTENNIMICIISEPPIRDCFCGSNWQVSKSKLAMILWYTPLLLRRCVLIRRGRDFIALKIDKLIIVSCYISPRVDKRYYLAFLDKLGNLLGDYKEHHFIIGGDFNARSPAWNPGTTNNYKGTLLEEWAAERDLRLINQGELPSSVNPRGSAAVDLTWMTAELASKTVSWTLDPITETLSDHNYITFEVSESYLMYSKRFYKTNEYPRWNYKLMDYDILKESLEWTNLFVNTNDVSPELQAVQTVLHIDNDIRRACDLAAPRAGKYKRKKNVHWWSTEIAELRQNCIRARRLLTKANRRCVRVDNTLEICRDNLRHLYKCARKKLRDAIRAAKLKSWTELINTINADPWGRPYLLVLGRLRQSRPGLTEILDDQELTILLDSLFPHAPVIEESGMHNFTWMDDYTVSIAEVMSSINKQKYSNTAPGLDGVRLVVWRKVPRCMLVRLADCFTKCLKEGVFPIAWKNAGLVLISKVKDPNYVGPIKARPICLLSVTGKLFERIIVERILKWMSEHPNIELSENQFGFRQGRSTYNALLKFKNSIENSISEGNVMIAVSIDVANAFNSIPFRQIIRAMINKGFPDYLIRIIQSYLGDRTVEYTVRGGFMNRRKVCAGVPQGSVLGPLLWNIAYNEVLETDLDDECSIIGYADDTLITVNASSIDVLQIRTNMQVAKVLRRICKLGLSVATDKTEIILFHGRKKPYRYPIIRVGDDYVTAGTSLKYLGIIFDSRLTFGEHFSYVAAKATKVVSALGRLMPNLRGPSESKRRLYANTVMSVLTYGSPVWYDAIMPTTASARRRQAPLLRVQRLIALRVVSAYRSVSLDAALILARIPPLYLLAGCYHRMYIRIKDLKSRLDWTPQEELEIRNMEKALMYRQWSVHIRNRLNPSGLRIRNAIAPVFREWINHSGKWGCNFHLTQILTGHGCFSDYLYRIHREDTDRCFHCYLMVDNAQHTLSECNAWQNERLELCRIIGPDLTLTSIFRCMLSSEDKWKAIKNFCETVMLEKENMERIRRDNVGNRGRTSSSDFDVP